MHIRLLNVYSSESTISPCFCYLREQHTPFPVRQHSFRKAYSLVYFPPSTDSVTLYMLCTHRRCSSIPATLDDINKVCNVRRASKAILLPVQSHVRLLSLNGPLLMRLVRGFNRRLSA